MKALYTLVFVLFSFAAPAQSLEASIAAYHLDDLDCSGETTRQSKLNQADVVATTGPNEAEMLVGATPPGGANAIAAYSSRSDGQLTDDTSGQSAMPPQIIAAVPTLEKIGEAKPTEANGVATTELNDAEDVPVAAVQPSEESSAAKYPTLSDDTITVDGTSEHGAMPAAIIATVPTPEKLGEAKPTEAKPTEANGVATTEPSDAEDAPVGAIQSSDESSTAKYSTLSDDTPTVDGTSGQSAMPAAIIATGSTPEKLGEAKPTEADGVATTALKDAEDVPVEAIQPNDENVTVKSDREARN